MEMEIEQFLPRRKWEKKKTITIHRTRKCKFGVRCKRADCKYYHNIFEKDTTFTLTKTVDMRHTKVCYDYIAYGACKYGHNKCNFSHYARLLTLPKCKFGFTCPNKFKTCLFLHGNDVITPNIAFEQMKTYILFDKNVIPLLYELFTLMNILTRDVEGIVIEYLKYK